MNKRGDVEAVQFMLWVGAMVAVVFGIIWMASIYYGAPYDIQGVESGILANQIENCMTSQGYLNSAVLSGNFQKDFMPLCHLNFNVENSYGWTNDSEYYAEVHVYKFDKNNPGLLGNEVLSVIEGNPNIKIAWKINSQTSSQSSQQASSGRAVNTIVIHSTEGSTAESAIQTISQRGLSVHYMIDRNGDIISQSNEAQYAPAKYADAFVPESEQGAHAGCGVGASKIQSCPASCVEPNGLRGTLTPQCQQLGGDLSQSQWCCIPDYNVNSIGIELVNIGNITGLCKNIAYKGTPLCLTAVSSYGDKWENFTQAQINSLVNLVSDIAARYNIPLDRNHIVGHYQIATDKTDPGPAFPWTSFMEKLNARGAISNSYAAPYNGEMERGFYVTSKTGEQYIVTVLALVGKNEKNVAQ